MQKLKVEKREINLTHFYGVFCLPSFSQPFQSRMIWLTVSGLPHPWSFPLLSVQWDLSASVYVWPILPHPQAIQLKEMLIYLAWYLPRQSFALCSRFTLFGDSFLSGLCVCETARMSQEFIQHGPNGLQKSWKKANHFIRLCRT